MSGLFFPRPARDLPPLTSSLDIDIDAPMAPPPLPSSSSPPPPLVAPRIPPNNFSQQRAAARVLRAEQKSPFVPRKKNTGKERDLSGLTVDDLTELLERNARILDSPGTMALLPGGDARIRTQQARIESRLHELVSLSQIKQELDGVHLDDAARIKKEEEEEQDRGDKMDDEGATTTTSSPTAKNRLASRVEMSSSPNSLTATLSLAESLDLQRQAVARDRKAAEARATKMQVDAARPKSMGAQLKASMGGHSQGAAMTGFMFHADSDDEEEGEDDDDELFGSGQLDDEEHLQLNPYRAAFEAGYAQAASEEQGAAREVMP